MAIYRPSALSLLRLRAGGLNRLKSPVGKPNRLKAETPLGLYENARV